MVEFNLSSLRYAMQTTPGPKLDNTVPASQAEEVGAGCIMKPCYHQGLVSYQYQCFVNHVLFKISDNNFRKLGETVFVIQNIFKKMPVKNFGHFM